MSKAHRIKEEGVQMSPMERERHKKMLTQKLIDKDPSVFLIKPNKSSKSCAWMADCFSLVYNNNVKENFVFCGMCSNLITYNSIHGTGSLLRHQCYRKVVNAQKEDDELNSFAMQNVLKNYHLKNESTDNANISTDSTADPLRLQMKCRDITKQKKDIEEMIVKGDPSIDIRPPANIKSEVWSNGNFKIIYKDGNKMDFVMCLYCNSLVTYKSKTGTASLLRHSCIKKLNAKQLETKTPKVEQQVEETISMPISELEQLEEADMAIESGENVTVENEIDQEQYLSSEFPDEFKDEASKLFQYFSYKDMQPANISQKKGFFSFGQYLINIGAEYGKVNIENILEERTNSNLLGDNFLHILQKMLKPKFEEHKIALSCDYWHDPNRKTNFLTLYGHYINELFEIRKANLGTVSFTVDFSSIDYKQLIVSILENYFASDIEAELFLSKTTTVIFEDMTECFKPFSTINCSGLILNQIVRQLLNDCNFREIIPLDILAAENWSQVWDYLEMLQQNSKSTAASEFMRILNPFTQALKSLTSEQKPTINEVYIFRKKLEDHFINTRFSNENTRDIVLNLIRESFPMTSVHKIAVFLDPRFKSLKFMSHEDKTNVLNMISKMIATDDATGNNVIAFADENDVRKPIALDDNRSTAQNVVADTADSTKYLIEYMDIVEERDETHHEVEVYMNLKFNDIYSANILEFWESRYDLPLLRQLAKEILCIPATAIVNEKMFSEDAMLFVKRRLNMEIDNIKEMLYIHENFDMLSNVL